MKLLWRSLLLAASLFIGPVALAQCPAHRINITWTASVVTTVTVNTGGVVTNVSNAPTSYIIMRGTAPGNEAVIAHVPATQTNWNDCIGISNGHQYFYKVFSINSSGCGISAEVSAWFVKKTA